MPQRQFLYVGSGEKIQVMLFINYFKSAARPTCLNLALARVILCLYCVWKVSTFPFAEVAAFPDGFLESNSHALLGVLRFQHPGWLLAEQIVSVFCLLCCAIGLWTGVAAFTAGLLVAHLAGLSFAFNADKTFLLPVYFFIFYGIYRTQDSLTFDRFRSLRSKSQEDLNALLQSTGRSPMAVLSALKWLLLALAGIYFFTGYGKIKIAGWGFDWAAADNIRLSLLHNPIARGIELPPVGALLLEQPWILSLMGPFTLFLELGFVVAVLAGRTITPFIVGLAGLHLGILLAMRVNYLTDMLFVYAAFFAWDSLAGRLQGEQKLTVVYDDKCSFCARVLLLAKTCDLTGGLQFVGSSDPQAPQSHNYRDAMFVFDHKGGVFRGYDGFVRLFDFIGLTRPIAWLMDLSPVAVVGRSIYAWVARNRSCLSACRIGN
jgi:predicted DCC family thiol-disulfide oxidoreductase YuxK